jgi:hypothetical protein
MDISMNDLNQLKSHTKSLMNHVHFVQQSFNLVPKNNHIGTCINYVDLTEYRDEFCEELVNTIPEWIYNQQKAAKIISDFITQEGRSNTNANSKLRQETFKKFRNRTGLLDLVAQGQFGELLLFNFLQWFFDAVPLIRKMPISTNVEMERFGADAIHYSKNSDKHLLYLGEAKTYSSNYKFNAAFKDALESILKTYKNHTREMSLYIYDDFIEDKLTNIAREYKNGTLKNVEVHLVSVIVYNETKSFPNASEREIKEGIMKIIEERGKKIEKEVFDIIDVSLHPRFNYVIFPIWKLDELLLEFQKLIGK